MKSNNDTYSRYHLVNEMFEAISIIREFESRKVDEWIPIGINSRIMLTGEGSSRLFPAKNIRHHSMILGKGPCIFTEGSFQLLDYKLNEFIVIGASNSGKTKELVQLFRELKNSGHKNLFSVTCNAGTPLEDYSRGCLILDICPELAVAATKSVIAQALVYEYLLQKLLNYSFPFVDLSSKFKRTLETEISPEVVLAMLKADTIYYAGFNNGVAEELALKTNEILRKKSGFLPGTYLLHGIEEVIQKNDVIILVDPVESEFEKIQAIYQKSIGVSIIALTKESSPFMNIPVPDSIQFHDGYLKLAAGWNLLVEAGIRLNVQLDKTTRARKIGNEFIET
jgi:glutamine---fructose-6-phosphate transaminase (isomerizing)